MSAQHGPDGGIVPIEFDDDLTQRERIERRENSVLEIGFRINPQSVGRSVTGRSDSGDAKRADNQMTMNTITSPARRLSNSLSAIVAELARLNTAVPTSNRTGDVGRVVIHEGLKPHPVELAEYATALHDAEAASTRQRVAIVNPGRDDDWLDEEAARIRAEAGTDAFE